MELDYSHASLFVLVATSFVSTSLDNLLLFAFLLQSQARWAGFAAFGYALACMVIVSLALAAALLGGSLDGAYVGYLGIVPVLLGLKMVYNQHFKSTNSEEDHSRHSFGSRLHLMWGTAAVMLGNSGDSLALFLPLFLDTQPTYYLFLVACYCLVAGLWIFTAHRVATKIGFAGRTLRIIELLAPLLMVVVGIHILMDTATDVKL